MWQGTSSATAAATGRASTAASAATAAAATTAAASQPTDAELYQRAAISELQRNLNNVFFDFDSSDLTDEARSTLSKNADWMKLDYVTAVVEVEGHCDNRGHGPVQPRAR